MWRALLAAVVLLTACSSPPKATAASPSLSAPPTSSQSLSAPTPSSQELIGDLPAIDTVADARGDIDHAGGFVHFQGGAFTPDPRAAMVQDPKTHLFRTATQPYLYGSGGISYNSAVARWLPVGRERVAADGLHYAYAESVFPANPAPGPDPPPTGVRIHVVDVRSASDRVVFESAFPDFFFLNVVNYSERGIYLSPGCLGGCGAEALKLWQLDAATGMIKKVSDRRGGWLIRDQVAWLAAYEGSSPPNQLLRLDLISGQVAIWLTDSGMGLIGTDSEGNPLVTLNGVASSALIRVTAPQQSEKLLSGPSNGQFSTAVADRQGTWLGGGQTGGQGIYLYAPGAGVRKVSAFPGLPVGLIH